MSAVESEDDVLEKMLMQAQRLALQMRSSTNSLDVSERSVTEAEVYYNEDANILSCDSDSHPTEPGTRPSLQSYFQRINQQGSEESKETISSGCEEKSYASVASEQQVAIDTALRAARDMELTLRSLDPDSNPNSPPRSPLSRSKSNETNRARRLSGSFSNLRFDEDLNTSGSHISWERIDSVNEDDEDYVPIVDYTSPKKKAIPRDDSDIKWEKISSPLKHEDDYVPIADYSRPPNRSPMQLFRGSILQSNSRKMMNGSSRSPWRLSRKKRRKILRATAIFLIVAISAYFVFFRADEHVTSDKTDAVISQLPDGAQDEETVSAFNNAKLRDIAESDSFGREDEREEELIEPEMSGQELERALFDVVDWAAFCRDQDCLSDEIDLPDEYQINVEDDTEASEVTENEGSNSNVDEVCQVGKRCETPGKRKLFSRENIERLIASMMQ